MSEMQARNRWKFELLLRFLAVAQIPLLVFSLAVVLYLQVKARPLSARVAALNDTIVLKSVSVDSLRKEEADVRARLRTLAAAIDTVQAHVDSQKAGGAAVQAEHPRANSPPSTLKEGWVYLGAYDSASTTWSRRYFSFGAQTKPASLEGKTVSANAQVNVRRNRFYEPGYDTIEDVLRPRSQVTITEIRSWNDAGYFIWAHVRFSVPNRSKPAGVGVKTYP